MPTPSGDPRHPSSLLPTLATWLPLIVPHLPAQVGRATRERLSRVASAFPADAMAVLEIPVPDPDAPRPEGELEADFALRLERALPNPAALGLPALESPTFDVAWWEKSRQAQIPGRSLGPCWLEFDWTTRGEGSSPILCFQLPRDIDPGYLLGEVLPRLGVGPGEGFELWRRLLANLSPPAQILYGFDLRARGASAQRCELVGLETHRAGDFLQRLGLDTLASLLPALLPWTGKGDRPHLSFDIGPAGALDRLGLENSFAHQPKTSAGWGEVLREWVARGRLAPNLAAELLAFTGTTSPSTCPAWPTQAPRGRGWLVRALSHFKAATRPGRPVELKVYLLWQYLPRRGGKRLNLRE